MKSPVYTTKIIETGDGLTVTITVRQRHNESGKLLPYGEFNLIIQRDGHVVYAVPGNGCAPSEMDHQIRFWLSSYRRDVAAGCI